jgi:hypothetical protein
VLVYICLPLYVFSKAPLCVCVLVYICLPLYVFE